MPVRINGATSGSVTLAAPATGSDVTLTLPGTTATVATLADPTFTGNVVLPSTTIIGGGTSLGAWTSTTPTATASSGTFTTVSATGAYVQIGKTVVFRGVVTITTAGTAAGNLHVTIPVAARSGANAVGSAFESQATGFNGAAYIDPSNSRVVIAKYDGTTLIASSRTIAFTVTYEAA